MSIKLKKREQEEQPTHHPLIISTENVKIFFCKKLMY